MIEPYFQCLDTIAADPVAFTEYAMAHDLSPVQREIMERMLTTGNVVISHAPRGKCWWRAEYLRRHGLAPYSERLRTHRRAASARNRKWRQDGQ